MTIKLPERKREPSLSSRPAASQSEPATESESVCKYLSDHPDFFDQNPELLNKMHVPHIERGSAVSLVERQVKNLRSDNHELNQQLQELLDIARENDRLAIRLHRFTLKLLGCENYEDVLSSIRTELEEIFKIDQVVLVFDGDSDQTHDLIKKLFTADAVATCFTDPDRGCFQALYNQHKLQSQEIRSSVVLPLGGSTTTGLLALGSTDEQRFRPGMSTTYLNRLTDLINLILAVHR